MTDTIFLHSAGGLIFDADRVLVIHWSGSRISYGFPKGTIEAGESPEQAAVREVEEESGYKTKIITPIGQTHYEYTKPDGIPVEKTVDYYLLERLDEADATPHREEYETFENEWLTINEALTLLTRDIDKMLLQKALAVRDSLVI